MTKIKRNSKFGWIPDIPDQRDYVFSVAKPEKITLPPVVDLRPLCTSVLDQLTLGSCTANAICNAHLFDQMKQKHPTTTLGSRLMLYYNERAIEGTINSDSGAQIRDGFKTLANDGICPESLWPYNIALYRKKPPVKCFTEAKKEIAITYRRVPQTLDGTQECLASGFPFVAGFTVYESFESKVVSKTGVVSMPSINESSLGGHAILVVGYDNTTKRFLVQNSWGTSWGMKGYFTIPFDYFLNSDLASDFWVVTSIK